MYPTLIHIYIAAWERAITLLHSPILCIICSKNIQLKKFSLLRRQEVGGVAAAPCTPASYVTNSVSDKQNITGSDSNI